MGYRVVMISKVDYAGSGYRMAEAIGLNSENHVEFFTATPMITPYDFTTTPTIAKQSEDGSLILHTLDLSAINRLIEKADLVHFKGDDVPCLSFLPGIKIPEDKPIIVTVHGSAFRRMSMGGSPKVSWGTSPIGEYIDASDFRTCGDPAMNYPEYDGVFTPVPIDVKDSEWNPDNRIVHTPSTRSKKGTDKFLEACKSLNVDVDLIENVSHAEVIERRKNALLFFDQCEAGFYGNAAIEAMNEGVPTACGMAPEAFKWDNGKLSDCPVINTGDTVESIAKAIKGYLDLPMEKKRELSTQSTEYVKRVHSYESVGKMWDKIYKEVLCDTHLPI